MSPREHCVHACASGAKVQIADRPFLNCHSSAQHPAHPVNQAAGCRLLCYRTCPVLEGCLSTGRTLIKAGDRKLRAWTDYRP